MYVEQKEIDLFGVIFSLKELAALAGVTEPVFRARLVHKNIFQALLPWTKTLVPRGTWRKTILTVDGISDDVEGWSKRRGVPIHRIIMRLRKGYPPEKCVQPFLNKLFLTVNGETDTFANWSKRSGIHAATIYLRIRKGWDPEKAVTKKQRGRLLHHSGEALTIREWADRLGVSRATVHRKLRDDPDNALTITSPLAGRPRNRTLLTANGITDTATGWSRRFGLPEGVLSSRLKRGWLLEEAIKTPTGSKREKREIPKNVKTITINGVTDTLPSWSVKLGANRNLVNKRIKEGWDPVLAATVPPDRGKASRQRSRTFKIGNITDTVEGWSKRSGIDARVIRTRIRTGWDPSSAVFTPRRQQSTRKNYSKISVGRTTDSLKGWAKRTGIAYQTLLARIKNGWSPEKAVTSKLHK